MARILVIDDEELIRMTITQVLEGRGHTVVTAVDGVDGLRQFREGAPFDLVITDIVMPNKPGLETIKELRALEAGVKIMAISGGSRSNYGTHLDAAKALGVNAVLRKPFVLADLCTTVDECLGSEATSSAA